ncbi:MAG: MFS transporter [Candidatus Firestonebacteria bacterium]|nr:MFS transporter [Candidatus Firestonebacteria bacterium]
MPSHPANPSATPVIPHPASKQVVLWMAILGGFLTPFMGSAINIALPAIGREFSLDALGLNWVATAYLLSAAMFLLPFGKLADIFGRKKVYMWGMAIYAVTSFLCGTASSGLMLVVFRVFQGLGGAMIFGTGMAILTSVFPPHERGQAIGISVSSVYLGLSLGPVAGGFLTQHLGWRSIFFLTVPMCFAVWVLVFWKLKGEWADAKNEKFDLPGSLVYSLALVSLIFGFSRLPAMEGVYCVAMAFIGFLLFVKLETRAKFPVLDLRLFKENRIFAFSSLAALINYSATFAVGFLLSLYLQYVQGMSPQQAGLVLISQPIFMAAFSPLAGRLSDRFEAHLVASLGMALTVVGMLLLLLLKTGTSVPFIVVSLIFIGFGFALFSSPNTNAVMGSVTRQFYGVASATLGTMRLTGQMLSMAITMLVMALYFGKTKITPLLHARFLLSMHTTFLIFSVLCTLGVFASLARGRNRK